MEPLRLVSTALVMFGISLVPGPAAAYCLAAGLESRSGFSVAAATGVTAGKVVHLVIAAAGALWVTSLSGAFRAVLLMLAAGFMVLQGLRRWRHGLAVRSNEKAPGNSSRMTQGFLISLLNPQSLASAVAVFPLLLGGDAGFGEAAVLTLAASVAVFAAYLVYEGVAALLARRLAGESQVRVVGATYMLAAIALAAIAIV